MIIISKYVLAIVEYFYLEQNTFGRNNFTNN